MHDYTWFPLALLGALVYGGYSMFLSLMNPQLKADKNAQLGYGVLLALVNIPLNIIAFYFWDKEYKNTSSKVLWNNLNWKVVAVTVLIRFLIDPVHAVVINAGGAVAQQTMYSLAIVPVLLGSWIVFKESLSLKQFIGLLMAGCGSWMMGVKSEKKHILTSTPRKV